MIPLLLGISYDRNWTMIITMIAMWMMQVSIYQIIRMIAMRNFFMTAIDTVRMILMNNC